MTVTFIFVLTIVMDVCTTADREPDIYIAKAGRRLLDGKLKTVKNYGIHTGTVNQVVGRS
jgi:hypothetical protein